MSGPLRHLLNRLLGQHSSPLARSLGGIASEVVGKFSQRVLLVVYDPLIAPENGRRLSEVFRWHDVNLLVDHFIADLSDASFGICNYKVVDRIVVDAFPVKLDGFVYTDAGYLTAWRKRSGFHDPDWADYRAIMVDFALADRVQSGQIDEVWMFAFPYGGFYESRMAGPGAFWCNAPPLEGFEHIGRRFVMMGFNYERGVGEMLESYGHRAESIMAQVFRAKRGEENLWERFCRYDLRNSGQAEVGNVHFAPNSRRDYDWGNRSRVMSRCDTWYYFPDLRGQPRLVSCDEWGNGDTRLHHLWWFGHFPHVTGQTGGISHNWWEYVIDPNRVL